jgi:integrase
MDYQQQYHQQIIAGKSASIQKHISAVERKAEKFRDQDQTLDIPKDASAEQIFKTWPREFLEWLLLNSSSKSSWEASKSALINHVGFIDLRHFKGLKKTETARPDHLKGQVSPEEIFKLVKFNQSRIVQLQDQIFLGVSTQEHYRISQKIKILKRNNAILALIIGSGGRRVNEVRDLTWGSIRLRKDRSTGALKFIAVVTKMKTTQKEWMIQLTSDSEFWPVFYEYWSEMKQTDPSPDQALFPSFSHKSDGCSPMTAESFQRLVSQGIGRSTHEMRRGTIKQMIESGVSPVEVAALVGHTNLNTTLRYFRAAKQSGLYEEYSESEGESND